MIKLYRKGLKKWGLSGWVREISWKNRFKCFDDAFYE